MKLTTPYYLIDECILLENLRKIKHIRKMSGAKVVLALKCFSTWCTFDLMRDYLDGTTSSSLYETRLGYEKFGKETHSFCVGYTKEEIKEIVSIFASKPYLQEQSTNKIIFNSISQLNQFRKNIPDDIEIGLRVNPGISHSHFDLANPARPYSRLGEADPKELMKVAHKIDGLMFHFNCENSSFNNFAEMLDKISEKYQDILNHRNVTWVSLGGGIAFTDRFHYPVERFCRKLKDFSKSFNVQVYLEPGEAVITDSTELVTKVVDIVHNDANIAIVDASIEPHMLDLLIYRQQANILNDRGKYEYMIAGRSCLAGDIFKTCHRFQRPLRIGSIIRIKNAAGYSIVKKNWFNGLQMPSIVIKKLDGRVNLIRKFNYNDFMNNLS
ncbi:MAG: carboxynorspermidine decarboxylase [Nitrosarchaeum sp.]|nr:carboxynorspermidine decarboxylase [Nitrosarchaeum sp.]